MTERLVRHPEPSATSGRGPRSARSTADGRPSPPCWKRLTEARAQAGSADLAAALLLIALSLLLRLHGLTGHGLYRDDAWPALAAHTDLAHAPRLGVTVPGFELLLRLWLGASRSTPWAQAPVLMASVSAVVAAYATARWVGCRREAALVAGGILALSPVSVLHATRVKQYSFDTVSAVVVLALAVRVVRVPASRPGWALLVAVSMAAALFSASVLPVTVSSVLLCGWWSWRAGGRAWSTAAPAMAAYAGFVALYSLVVLRAVPEPLRESWQGNYIEHSGVRALVSSSWHVLDEFSAGIFYRHGPLGPLVVVALGASALWCRRDFAPLLVGPVVVALALAFVHRAPFGGGRTDEYLYPCVALAAAIVAEGVLARTPLGRLDGRLVAVALAVALAAFALTRGLEHVRANPYPAVDMAALVSAVDLQREVGDGVVVGPFSRHTFAFSQPARSRLLFSQGHATGFTVVSSDPDVLVLPADAFERGFEPAGAIAFGAGRHRLWYIATDTPVSDTPAAIQAVELLPEQRLLDAGFRRLLRIDRFGGHADLLVRDGG